MNLDNLINMRNLSWQKLDGELNAKTSEDFSHQFKIMFSCPKAREAKGVVYVWATQKGIPRLRGTSDIIYFGMTTQTLHDRHYQYAMTEGDEYNWPRYKHIIENFGPFRVYFAITPEPKNVESELLKEYYKDHCEIPPVNRSGC